MQKSRKLSDSFQKSVLGNFHSGINFKIIFALVLLSTSTIPLNQAFAAGITTINVSNSVIFSSNPSVYGSTVRLTVMPTIPSTSDAAVNTVVTAKASPGLIYSISASSPSCTQILPPPATGAIITCNLGTVSSTSAVTARMTFEIGTVGTNPSISYTVTTANANPTVSYTKPNTISFSCTDCPSLIKIQSPIVNSVTKNTPVISGISEKLHTIIIKDGDSIIGNVISNSNNQWSFTPTIPLIDGPHLITATDIDAKSKSGTSTPIADTKSFIVDATAPIITVLSNITLELGDDTTPDSTGYATSSDPTATITFTDVTAAGTGNVIQTISRTWTATDAAGNTSYEVQTITVQDATAPTITVPSNITLELGDNTTPDSTGYATSSDPTATITFADVTAAGTGNVIQTISRTWTATDPVGNTSSEVQTITVQTHQQTGKISGGGSLDKNINFGFIVKSNAKQIHGMMLYQDKTANIEFHSFKIITMSFSKNTNAIFTGKGTFNHVSGYTFDVSVEDNGKIGKNDSLSIKIKDPNGNEIYAKQGLLYKGNIIIHK